MDGSPLARLLIVAIFLGLLGLPVVALTRDKSVTASAVPTPIPAAVNQSQTIDLSLTLSQPGQIEVRQADRVIVASDAPVSTLEKSVTLTDSEVEFSVKFQWSDGSTSHAGRLVVSRDGDTLADQTFWGTTEAEDVVSFRMSKP